MDSVSYFFQLKQQVTIRASRGLTIAFYTMILLTILNDKGFRRSLKRDIKKDYHLHFTELCLSNIDFFQPFKTVG